MAAFSRGRKHKLLITRCTIEKNGNIKAGKSKSDKFTLQLNPSSYSHQYSICYDKRQTVGQAGQEVRFAAQGAEQVSFDVVIDGTGVVSVPIPIPGYGPDDVKTQIEDLTDIVYKYESETHQTSVVRLLWGSLIFFGRLTSMTAEYVLFKPNGEPLRAKVKMAFTGFMSKEEEKLVANRSSPDLSHSVEVRDGDTLPLMCHRIYKDSSYYVDVALYNNISAFRTLRAGERIRFPPLTSMTPAPSAETGPSGSRRGGGSARRRWRRRRRERTAASGNAR